MTAPLRIPQSPSDRELAAQLSLRTARCLGLLNAAMLYPKDMSISKSLGDELIELLKANNAAMEAGALMRWQEGLQA